MPDIFFGPWTPDLPDLDNPGMIQALNAYPRTQRSYGPWRNLANVSTNSLDERCLGAVSANDISDVSYTFAGDRAKLYRLLSSSFTDVSKALGYNTNPNTIESNSVVWRFRAYRSLIDLVVASNFDDPLQSWTLGVSAAFGDMAPTTGPRARYMDVVRDHLVLGHTFDAFDGERSSRVWFSPRGNPADDDWGNVNKLSDFQDLRSGGAITGIVGGEFGLIFCESSIYQMIFSGPPLIYEFNEIVKNHGCIAPGSIVSDTNKVFYLSRDGFFVTTGGAPTPIGLDKVDITFFADIDREYFGRISANIDPVRNLYCVAYPGPGNTNGTPNRILLLNYEIGHWAIVDQELTVMATTLSPGLTLEELGVIYPTVEDIPGTTDDPQWAGGNEIFGAFTVTNMLASFTGDKKRAVLETPEANVIPDERAKRIKARALADGGPAELVLGRREQPTDIRIYSEPRTPNSRTGLASFSQDAARYHTLQVIKDDQEWTEAYGVSVQASRAGAK